MRSSWIWLTLGNFHYSEVNTVLAGWGGADRKSACYFMPRRKKKFACGHKGYGQICHRCIQKHVNNAQKKQAKQEWEAMFECDPINLRDLPKNVVVKARRIIARLENQHDYRDFRGKRLRHDRFVISIPVTRNYRLLCRDCGSFLVPECVISHEDYNVCKPGG